MVGQHSPSLTAVPRRVLVLRPQFLEKEVIEMYDCLNCHCVGKINTHNKCFTRKLYKIVRMHWILTMRRDKHFKGKLYGMPSELHPRIDKCELILTRPCRDYPSSF